ncbi:MAG: hypothetical protein GX101_07980 [Firmicutes bacterium]|jgi:N-acetylmuramoyl-L-alanine amidase|nr:cell wall hydrolase [Bacillota bacterium]NLO66605.1 hypothetical protein [Bacillota bacterium]
MTEQSRILPSQEGGFFIPAECAHFDLEDWQLLAQLVYAEARGEPFWGQVAVAAVVLNRVKHPDFPSTVREVIFQPRQFEPVDNKAIYNAPNNLAYQAVQEALEGQDPTDGALFFWNPAKVSPKSWVWTRQVKLRLGNHVFA